MTDADAHSDSCAYFGLDRRRKQTSPNISVVMPVCDEEGALPGLINEIGAALCGLDYELIIVDDGSTDGTRGVLENARADHPRLRVIRHGRTVGQSRSVHTGILAARASLVVTLDGDGQNDPADIPLLLKEFENAAGGTVAMVAGERRIRRDTVQKKIASRLANAIRRRILKDGAADTACGLKVFRRDVYLRLPRFDSMHRYMPALMGREGFATVFAPVNDRPRQYGRSKYTNWGRFLAGIVDMAGVYWLMARARSPVSIHEERN
jgi:dolichol-phosphate mannosyltransferase